MLNKCQDFLPFAQARAFARTLKLKNRFEWYIYCEYGKKPGDIPHRPERTSRTLGWLFYSDWFVYVEYEWTPSKIKELRRTLEQCGLILQWKCPARWSSSLRRAMQVR